MENADRALRASSAGDSGESCHSVTGTIWCVNIQFADMSHGNLFHELLSSQNDSEEFQKESQNVSKKFQKIRDEVMGQYGYDSLGKESVHTANSTQEEYVTKTRARCDCEFKGQENKLYQLCMI